MNITEDVNVNDTVVNPMKYYRKVTQHEDGTGDQIWKGPEGSFSSMVQQKLDHPDGQGEVSKHG